MYIYTLFFAYLYIYTFCRLIYIMIIYTLYSRKIQKSNVTKCLRYSQDICERKFVHISSTNFNINDKSCIEVRRINIIEKSCIIWMWKNSLISHSNCVYYSRLHITYIPPTLHYKKWIVSTRFDTSALSINPKKIIK